MGHRGADDMSEQTKRDEDEPLGAWDIPDEDDDPSDFDCGKDRNGNCGKAGSEECDFECPYRG